MVEEKGWPQPQAATPCVVAEPRMNHLLRERVARFSLDGPVNIATALGRRVRVAIEAA